jgi:prepilin peptidase CpaA
MGIALSTALILSVGAFPIGIWVAWSDMKFMKIPNKSVIALAGVWAILGLVAVAATPLTLMSWAIGWGLGMAVLALGFVGNAAGLFGAGDAKFAAAMAPFFVGADLRLVLGLFSACLLAAFTAHRLGRMIPALRRVAPDWASWTNAKFPMGLALSGTLIFYLLAPLLPLFAGITGS